MDRLIQRDISFGFVSSFVPTKNVWAHADTYPQERLAEGFQHERASSQQLVSRSTAAVDTVLSLILCSIEYGEGLLFRGCRHNVSWSTQ